MVVGSSSVLQAEKDLQWDDVWDNILSEDQGGHGSASDPSQAKPSSPRKSWRKSASPYQRPYSAKQRQRAAMLSKYATLSQYADPIPRDDDPLSIMKKYAPSSAREDIARNTFEPNSKQSSPKAEDFLTVGNQFPSEANQGFEAKSSTKPMNLSVTINSPTEKSSHRRERGSSPYLRRSASPSPSRANARGRMQSAARFDDFSSRFKKVPTETNSTQSSAGLSRPGSKELKLGTTDLYHGDFKGDNQGQAVGQRDVWGPSYAVSAEGDLDASSRNLHSVESNESLAEILDKADATLLSSLERGSSSSSSTSSQSTNEGQWRNSTTNLALLALTNNKQKQPGQLQQSSYVSFSDSPSSPTQKSNFWRRKASVLPVNMSERKAKLLSSMNKEPQDGFEDHLDEDDDMGCVDKSKDSLIACIVSDSDDDDEHSLSGGSPKTLKANSSNHKSLKIGSNEEVSHSEDLANCIEGSDQAAVQSMKIFNGIAKGIDDFLDPDFARTTKVRSPTNRGHQSSLPGDSSTESGSGSSASSQRKYSKERELQRARAHAKSLARVRANKMYSFNDDEKEMNLRFSEQSLPAISEESDDSTFKFSPSMTESKPPSLKSKLVLRSPTGRQENLQQMLLKTPKQVRFENSSDASPTTVKEDTQQPNSPRDTSNLKLKSCLGRDKSSSVASASKEGLVAAEKDLDFIVSLRASSDSTDGNKPLDSTPDSAKPIPSNKLVLNHTKGETSQGSPWNKSLLASYSRQVNACAMFRMRPARADKLSSSYNQKPIAAQNAAALFPKTKVYEYDNGELICKTASRSFEEDVYASAKMGHVSPTNAVSTLSHEYEYDSGNHKKIVYEQFGAEVEKVLELKEYQAPPVRGNQGLAENSVIIKVEASTVSEVDCAVRSGALAEDLNVELPITPGVDFCGKLFRIDKEAGERYKLRAGDRVMALVKVGGNSRFIGLDPAELVKVPESVDPVEAVCLAENYASAFQILQYGQSKTGRYRQHSLVGRTILISGDVPSVLSRAIAKLCPILGCTNVFATAKEKHFDIVTAMGMTPVEADSPSWQNYLLGSVDILIHLGGDMSTTLANKVLRPSGHLVVASSYDKGGSSPPVSIMCSRVLANLAARTYHHNVFKTWDTNRKQSQEDLTFLLDLLERRLLVPHVIDRIELADVPNANLALEAQRQSGHIVCEPWLRNKTNLADP